MEYQKVEYLKSFMKGFIPGQLARCGYWFRNRDDDYFSLSKRRVTTFVYESFDAISTTLLLWGATDPDMPFIVALAGYSVKSLYAGVMTAGIEFENQREQDQLNENHTQSIEVSLEKIITS